MTSENSNQQFIANQVDLEKKFQIQLVEDPRRIIRCTLFEPKEEQMVELQEALSDSDMRLLENLFGTNIYGSFPKADQPFPIGHIFQASSFGINIEIDFVIDSSTTATDGGLDYYLFPKLYGYNIE